MPFETYENQQRISLSPFSWEIIQQDMLTFDNDKFSNFINRIFENFYPIAESSIAYKINRIENQLRADLETLLKKPAKQDVAEDSITLIVNSEKEKARINSAKVLERKKFSYISKVFRINEKNLNYLCGTNTATQENYTFCEEDEYYGLKRRKDYIECVLEEYCSLPYIEREKVYFSSWFDIINYSIKNERQINVEIDQKDIVYRIRPYDIRTNVQHSANYLVGYDSNKTKIVSIRISALKSIKSISSSAHLYKTDKENLEDAIAQKGIEYLSYPLADVVVRFTEEGVRLYNRILALRPLCKTQVVANVECEFKCTLQQAKIYFWRLANSIEIIAPQDLRDYFCEMYENGDVLYNP